MGYTQEDIIKFKEEIINSLSEGKSLKSILDNNKHLPNRTTVYTWLNEKNNKYDESFLNNYARARKDSADLDAETIQEIAVKTLKGVYDPSAARVALDAYKWSAGRKNPKKYGDQTKVQHSSDPDNPIKSIPLVLSDGRSYEDLKDELKPE